LVKKNFWTSLLKFLSISTHQNRNLAEDLDLILNSKANKGVIRFGILTERRIEDDHVPIWFTDVKPQKGKFNWTHKIWHQKMELEGKEKRQISNNKKLWVFKKLPSKKSKTRY
jgi:hypothetical protein